VILVAEAVHLFLESTNLVVQAFGEAKCDLWLPGSQQLTSPSHCLAISGAICKRRTRGGFSSELVVLSCGAGDIRALGHWVIPSANFEVVRIAVGLFRSRRAQ
jgi:hypothetical protein